MALSVRLLQRERRQKRPSIRNAFIAVLITKFIILLTQLCFMCMEVLQINLLVAKTLFSKSNIVIICCIPANFVTFCLFWHNFIAMATCSHLHSPLSFCRTSVPASLPPFLSLSPSLFPLLLLSYLLPFLTVPLPTFLPTYILRSLSSINSIRSFAHTAAGFCNSWTMLTVSS